MNLRGSIAEYQKRLHKIYLQLSQGFSENNLVRTLWNDMAHDISRQIQSLNALPRSFWNQLNKSNQKELLQAVQSAQSQVIEIKEIKKEDLSLKACFEKVLQIEEPVILSVYVPLIRRLRESWTDQALDFYIMVKSHLARIARIIEAYAGDPFIIQRSGYLVKRFEKEVQEPQILESAPVKKERAYSRRASPPRSKTPRAAHAPRIQPQKIHPRAAKPILKKVALRGRQA